MQQSHAAGQLTRGTGSRCGSVRSLQVKQGPKQEPGCQVGRGVKGRDAALLSQGREARSSRTTALPASPFLPSSQVASSGLGAARGAVQGSHEAVGRSGLSSSKEWLLAQPLVYRAHAAMQRPIGQLTLDLALAVNGLQRVLLAAAQPVLRAGGGNGVWAR